MKTKGDNVKLYFSKLIAAIIFFFGILFLSFIPVKASLPQDFISIYTVVFHPGQNLQNGSSFSWDFDNDGIEDSSEIDGSYVFPGPGSYSVKLTTTSSDGVSNSVLKTITINESLGGGAPPPPPPPAIPSNWLDAAWKGRTKITIAAGKVEADLVDFPVYLNLNDLGSNSDFWIKTKTNCSDIRITKADGKTELPRELVACDVAAKTGEVHFKVAGTLSSSAANKFYIYYGNPNAVDYAASDALGRENVWNANYKAVWHFQEANATYVDSTVNHIDGIGMNGPTRVSTNIGYGVSCDGGNDYIDLGNKINLSNNFTISTVFKSLNWGNVPGTLIAWGFNNTAKTRRVLSVMHTNHKLSFDTNWTNIFSTPVVALNSFSHAAAIMDASSSVANVALWLDNVKTSGSTDYVAFSNSESRICANGGGGEAKFNGIITEMRISSTQRSEAWIKAEHSNLINNNFYLLNLAEVI